MPSPPRPHMCTLRGPLPHPHHATPLRYTREEQGGGGGAREPCAGYVCVASLPLACMVCIVGQGGSRGVPCPLRGVLWGRKVCGVDRALEDYMGLHPRALPILPPSNTPTPAPFKLYVLSRGRGTAAGAFVASRPLFSHHPHLPSSSNKKWRECAGKVCPAMSVYPVAQK